MNVILYTRSGCHLCDIAHQTLIEHGLQPEKVDIDTSEALCEQFNTCVPVVEIDGKVRFRGQVDHRLLKRLLRNREEPQP
jgi:glutaredoxin